MHVRNIWFLALATCTEGIRHKALWAIVCMAILLTMANLGVTTLYSWDLGKVSVEFGLSAVAFTGLLLVFFLGMKILADDLERSRIFMLLSRPVSIWQYLTGKFLGLAMILGLATIILGVASGLSMRYVLWRYAEFVPPDFSWLTCIMALACQWLSLVVVLALSVLCFSFAKQPFVALLLAVSSYLVGQNMELLRRVVVENPQAGALAGQEQLVVALSWIFPNLSLFDKKYEAAYGMAFSGQEFVLLCLYGISYSALLLYLATLLFRRKELA
jgi:ABC-type transport system involved in multi-copper enzyme maturation permease subunit